MKVSQIIELALKEEYGRVKPFMCNCVNNLIRTHDVEVHDAQKAVDAIWDLMKEIAGPDRRPWATLVNTLWDADYVTQRDTNVCMPYTTELYVWWVFDLKNKGL